MKKLIAVFLCFFTICVVNAQKPADVNSIIKQTCVEAGKQHKKAFIIFHASWCIWCRKLDSSMNDVSCKKYFDSNFIITHLTAFEIDDKAKLNTPGNEAFLAAHHAIDQGIPTWFIFDENGNLLADSQLRHKGEGFDVEGSNVGCPSNETEINYFISILQKVSDISESNITSVKARFLKNAATHQ